MYLSYRKYQSAMGLAIENTAQRVLFVCVLCQTWYVEWQLESNHQFKNVSFIGMDIAPGNRIEVKKEQNTNRTTRKSKQNDMSSKNPN